MRDRDLWSLIVLAGIALLAAVCRPLARHCAGFRALLGPEDGAED